MTPLIPGYSYSLDSFESDGKQPLNFVRKELNPETGKFELAEEGTTNEEVLKMLIHRMGVLQAKGPCRENAIAITKMEEALMWLERRHAERASRGVSNTPIP